MLQTQNEPQTKTAELTEEQGLARLCVVSLIQSVGVYLTIGLNEYLPLFFGLTEEAGWQRDCLKIASVLRWTITMLFFTLIGSYLLRWKPKTSEVVIIITFVVNIFAFSLAMVRTGGPAHSFFAQLVPMQLSGILILEQQKAMMTSQQPSKRWRALLYAVFAIVASLTVVCLSKRFQRLFGWQDLTMQANQESYARWVATTLFILGMIVTAFAYLVTPRLADSIRRRRNAGWLRNARHFVNKMRGSSKDSL